MAAQEPPTIRIVFRTTSRAPVTLKFPTRFSDDYLETIREGIAYADEVKSATLTYEEE